MAARGWGEEKFIPMGQLTSINKERGGGKGVKIFLPSPAPYPPPSTLTANQKWPVEQPIASFLALARTNKTPALQAIILVTSMFDLGLIL